MDKSKIQHIRARQRKEDFVYDGIVEQGYDIFKPYYGNALVPRIIREIWFRGNLPRKDIWFNKQACSIDSNKKVILLKDPLIRPDYLEWLRKHNPEIAIVLEYENRAMTTIHPDLARPYVTELVSYDQDDCEKYGMTYRHFSICEIPDREAVKGPIERDVLYVGRDKGRYDKLVEIKERFEAVGVNILLHVCANRSFQRFSKPYYKKFLNYQEYIQMVGRSKAILNIMPEGQKSITVRDVESILYEVKEITNNKSIKDFEFYDPTRYFVLDVDDDKDLPKFLETEFKTIPSEELLKYSDENVLGAIINKYL